MFSGKKVYDITRPLKTDMTVWPGDGGVTVVKVASIGEGSMANVSRVNMGVHSGTHMDAPLHFIEGGADIARISLDKLMGEVIVIEAGNSIIDASLLDGVCLEAVDAVFFKTPLSGRDIMEPFFEQYPGITEECAKILTSRGIGIVGTDYFSVESFNNEQFSVHKHLLSNHVALVENLCMTGIEPGRYSFISLPLKIEGSDGSPCRVLLFK